MKKRIKEEVAEKDGWSRWIQPITRGYIMSCCDCGLCHRMNFRISHGRVQFKTQRAPGYTRQERRRIARRCK